MNHKIVNVVGKIALADRFDTARVANLAVKRCGRRKTYVIHGMKGDIMDVKPLSKNELVVTKCDHSEFNAIVDEIRKTNNVVETSILNFVLKFDVPFRIDIDKVFYAIDGCKKVRGLQIVTFNYKNSKVIVSSIGRGAVAKLTRIEEIDEVMDEIAAILARHRAVSRPDR